MENKLKYTPAQLELICFDNSDIITTSNELGDSGFDYNGWTRSIGDWG